MERNGWLSGEGVVLVIRRLPDRFPAVPNNIVSLGKTLHPYLPRGGMSLYLLKVALDKSVC